MKINSFSSIQYNFLAKNSNDIHTDEKSLPEVNSSKIVCADNPIKLNRPSFGAISHTEKIELDKKKLLRHLNEILENDIENIDPEDYIAQALRRTESFFRKITEEKTEILQKLEEIDAKTGPLTNRDIEEYNSLLKRWKTLDSRIQKKRAELLKKIPEPTSSNTDFVLVNRFKTAVLQNNFNLDEVASNYYKELENIETVEELKEKYPKIPLPQNPRDVIAKKFVASLTKSFYKDLDAFIEQDDNNGATELISSKIEELWGAIFPENPMAREFCFYTSAESVVKETLSQYIRYKTSNMLDSIPEKRKHDVAQLAVSDITMLMIDFDDYVLSTVREHYLNGKKLADIVYENNGIKLSIGSIKEGNYKFTKQSEKIKSIIKTARQIKLNERDYEKYDVNSLRSRLDYFASSPMCGNDVILGRIIDFYSCNFEDEDKKQLILFLKELDKLLDLEKTEEEVIGTVYSNNIRPIETERKIEIERKNEEIRLKEEQKKSSFLNILKSEFDEVINFLYSQNLTNLANLCSKYRPENTDDIQIEKANFIINTVKKEIELQKKSQENTLNKAKIESAILRWNTFNYYKEHNPNNEFYKMALVYAQKEDGKIDEDKAGQYIINAELVETYPESKAFIKNPDILETIMEKEGKDKDSAIRYLCRYNDYESLPSTKKTKLSSIMELFNVKNSTEKAILKSIVENEYVKSDTVSKLSQGTDGVITAIFGKSAKQQILERYKFPLCLDFLEGFENATSLFAPYDGATGIKQTGRNNKTLSYKMEAKLSGHDDRLFSSKNDFYFDIYSPTGLH